MAQGPTRAFLVGGPADGRTLLLQGRPFDFRIPTTPPLAFAGPPEAALEPIEVVTYRRGQVVSSSDGRSVLPYVFEEPSPPKMVNVVVLARDARVADLVVEEAERLGFIPPASSRHSFRITPGGPGSERFRGLNPKSTVVLRGHGADEVYRYNYGVWQEVNRLRALGVECFEVVT